jgi:DedD protein
MDSQLKQRLVGAVTLVALGIIVIPIVLDGPPAGREGSMGMPRAYERGAGWRPPPAPARRVVEADRPAAARPLAGLDPVAPDTAADPVAPPDRGQREARSTEAIATTSGEKPAVTKVEGRSSGKEAMPAPPSTEGADVGPEAQASSTPSPGTDVPTDQTTWSLQVASFRDRERAAMIRSQLQSAGYPAFVRNANLGGRVWYQVLVGPGLSRGRAETLREEIYTSFKAKRLVVERGMLVRNP